MSEPDYGRARRMSGRVDSLRDAPAFMRDHPEATMSSLRRALCPLDGSRLVWMSERQPLDVETPPLMRCERVQRHGWWQTNGAQMAWYAAMPRSESDLRQLGWLGWDQSMPGYPTPGPGADTLALVRELVRRIETGE